MLHCRKTTVKFGVGEKFNIILQTRLRYVDLLKRYQNQLADKKGFRF